MLRTDVLDKGHTETARITAMFGGRLVAICQRLADLEYVDESARAEMLLIEGGRLSAVSATGARLPL